MDRDRQVLTSDGLHSLRLDGLGGLVVDRDTAQSASQISFPTTHAPSA
jgi:hypothetical protein